MNPGAVARIALKAADGVETSRGAGFLVSDDLVVTAYHVIAPLADLAGATIEIQFPQWDRSFSTAATLVEDAFSPEDDWAFLRCKRAPRGLSPLKIADETSGSSLPEDLRWTGFGFPESDPVVGRFASGLVQGEKELTSGTVVLQLFSLQAADGIGEKVSGYSGSPVVVDDYVVGVIQCAEESRLARSLQARFVRDRGAPDDFVSAGTFYATHIRTLVTREAVRAKLPHTLDPLWGIPALVTDERVLPAEPYRYLATYEKDHAEIFFGRRHDIRTLYRRLRSLSEPRVLLLYGSSGVGKSSLIHAGLAPRLGNDFVSVRDVPSFKTALKEWRSRPPGTVMVLDQFEEILKSPSDRRDYGQLLCELALALADEPDQLAKPGKIVFSYRKEWDAELRSAIRLHDIRYTDHLVVPLDRAGVLETVTGLQSTERLRKQYRLEFEDEALPNEIVNELTRDSRSNVAPRLQVLLSWMWEQAEKRRIAGDTGGKRVFTWAQYRRARETRADLEQYLVEELRRCADRLEDPEHREHASAGLLLDLLSFHVSALVTAESKSEAERRLHYGEQREAEIGKLVDSLRASYLLMETQAHGDTGGERGCRLVHDALAPVVLRELARSPLPGPRARRRLHSATRDQERLVLDEDDLKLVQEGEKAMRAITAAEARGMLETSLRSENPAVRSAVSHWRRVYDDAAVRERTKPE